MRELWRWLSALPRSLLVQPEQLGADVAYAIALLPPLALGLLFFRRPAALLLALCLLAGIICLLALRLAALTIGLPPWVGHRANHPLVAALLLAAFFSPLTPLWLGVSLVVVYILLESLAWPHLRRIAIHPALLCVGILSVVQLQLGTPYISPFDGRPLGDPLSLHTVIDPMTMYVGNVPGPLGATSAAAVLLGIGYLWYARKISLTLVAGFIAGMGVAAAAFRLDVAFQLSSGAALYLAGYLAADRRRLPVGERISLGLGALAGAMTIVLRWRGQGQAAAWESLLLVTAGLSLIIRVRMLLETRSFGAGLWRRTAVRSGAQPSALRPAPAVLTGLRAVSRGPAVAPPAPPQRSTPASPGVGAVTAPVAAPVSIGPLQPAALRGPLAARTLTARPSAPARPTANDDIVRQMRSAAMRSPGQAQSMTLRLLALVVLNPVGLWLTWRDPAQPAHWKSLVTAISLLWYAAVAGAIVLVGHQAIRL